LYETEGKDRGWRVVFRNRGKEIRGVVNLTNELPYGDWEEFKKRLGHISKFDFEKYMRTNNWNPAVVIIRSTEQKIGEPIDLKEIHMNGYRGFWESRQSDILFSGDFSLYKKKEDQFIGGAYLMLKKYFDESDILTILSSMEILEPEGLDQANKHYEKGLRLYQSGDILQAQIEFANAYYLSPENPDYTFMLAKSVYLKDQEFLDYTYIKDLLNKVLKLKPSHKEAHKLLKEIEPRVPKEAKKLETR
jgi:tetratricopeptide (TPR) repeat protein